MRNSASVSESSVVINFCRDVRAPACLLSVFGIEFGAFDQIKIIVAQFFVANNDKV